jgi:glycosyltransferase involved in cell wall biosynthesis
LKVLIIAQYFPPDIGGAATRAYNLAKGLALNGCNVTVIAAFPHYPHGNIPEDYRWKPIKVEQMDNFKVIRTLMPPIKSEGFFKRLVLIGFFGISSLFALPLVNKVDVIWASSFIPGYIYKKIKRKPLALNVDDLTLEDLVDLELLDKNSLALKIGSIVYRLFFVKGDILTPVSPGYFRILSSKYGVKPERLHLVRGGVDLSTFKRTCPRAPNEKFIVLYSGSFSIAYDFNQIFRAAKIIEETDDKVEFVVQGAGELLNSMQCAIKKLGVKNVKIVNRIISRTEVGELLRQSDALVLPLACFFKSGNPYRGMSSKLYEYQAVGQPIISCSRGVPSFYINESRSGIVVDPGDAQALASAVVTLKNNPDLAREMGANGRQFVENGVSIQAIGKEMKKIFLASCLDSDPESIPRLRT